MKALQPLPSLLCTVYLAVAGASLSGAESSNLELAHQLNQAFVEVAEKVSPAVVVITVTEKPPAMLEGLGEGAGEEPTNSLPQHEFWRRFHRQLEDQSPQEIQSQGSGIIIRKDGFILTNRHVVEGAAGIIVRLLDGRSFKAKVRGVDPQSDVAVIKIEADNLPVARFADSSRTHVGEFAIAIGAPFNLDYSVTYGHVSAKSRSNVVPGIQVMDQDFIQTDANINPGNSGGPLVNIDGEVIGINTLIRGLHTGIGFAIPSNLAREVADQLIAEGKFTRAWLGIEIESVKDNPDFHEAVPGIQDGVIVRSILPGGPAAKSDLHPGDVITAVDGQTVNTSQQLRNVVRGKSIGRTVDLDVFRSGKVIRVKIKPGEYAEAPVAFAGNRPAPEEALPTGLGISVHALTPELADQFGVNITEGVIVVSVDKNSPADRKNIKPGDIITALGQQPVANPKQFSDALKKADLKKGVIVNLISGITARFEILKEGGD